MLSQDITRTYNSNSHSGIAKSTNGLIISFLDLMASSPVSFFVPTLDIDLAWHTHQLMAKKYKSDSIIYVGRFIDQ
jgi:hypothetical protein